MQNTVTDDGGAGYRAFKGTSMAAPHVSGALAVLLGMGLAPDAAVDVLFRTAIDVGEDGFDEMYGHGRLHLGAAVSHVVWWDRLPRFLAGGLLALALGLIVGLDHRTQLILGAAGAWAAGGLVFLSFLPISPGGGLAWLALDPLRLAGAWLGPGWTHNWFVASGVVPLAGIFLFGLHPRLAPWVAGLAIGTATNLLSGALDGTLAPFGSGWDAPPWLLGHAAAGAIGAALACTALEMEYAA